MTIKTKAKGYRAELKVKKALEDLGLFVIRHSASRFPDLIALNPAGETWLVECKVKKLPKKTPQPSYFLSKKELKAFETFKDFKNVKCLVAVPFRKDILLYDLFAKSKKFVWVK